MLRAVIFDFDGLILDTEFPWFTGWTEIYADYGQKLELETYAPAIGKVDGFDPHAYLEQLTGQQLARDTLRERHRARVLSLISELPLLDGVTERLMEARSRGLKIGLASSSDPEWVGEHLDRYDLTGFFDVVRCFGPDHPSKPSPALYIAALEQLDVLASDAVAFEDSPHGIAAAQAAGVHCIAVPNQLTAMLDLSAADEIILSLATISLGELALRWR